jgi:predicted GNAT superfamily acetyltransferase
MASIPRIEPIAPADEPAVLAFNNLHAAELSWLEPQRLSHLLAEAFLALRVGSLDAFMIAFDQDADYDSPNFLWFRERYPRFAYVDRIAVAAHARGRNLARRLYERLFEEAGRRGYPVVTCEVNLDPPNPGSDAFHLALGFEDTGHSAPHGIKTVRYYVRRL